MKAKLFSSAVCKGVIDKENRIVHVIASTGVIDRHGESVNPEGWLLENFLTNPVALIAHDYRSLPVGKFVKVWIEDGALQGHVQIADTQAGQEVFYLIEGGYLNTVSVGFIVKKWGVSGQDAYTIMQQELLEISFVAVPANPEALVVNNDAKSKFEILEKEIKEKGEEKEQIIKNIALDTMKGVMILDIGDSEKIEFKVDSELLQSLAKQAKYKDITEAIEEVLSKYKVVEEKIVEKIVKVKDDSLSDDALSLMMKIRKEVRKSDRHSGLSLKLINSLLQVNSSQEKGVTTK